MCSDLAKSWNRTEEGESKNQLSYYYHFSNVIGFANIGLE